MTALPLILLIEDTASLQATYAAILTQAGYRVTVARTACDGIAAFKAAQPDAVVLDLMLPDRDGLEVIRDFLELAADVPVIAITANGSVNGAVEAMRAGATEFLVKPFDEQRFLAAVAHAAARPRDGAPVRPNRATVAPPGDFIGSSPPMQTVYAKIRSVARSTASVFITGESGTGKELCAEAIHRLSNRAAGPFIALNCGAIPAELLESEVFGHIKGSFTGAIADKPGAAVTADGGTLFLDEICELDLSLQTKLLRFLQTSMVQPVGANRPRKVNVRIICATNRDPMEAVRRGQFREDLFYRLHVVPIHMPPLRDRGEDVIEIAERALTRMAAEEGRQFKGLDGAVRELLASLPWPGNVRQLLNMMRHVVVMNDGPLVTLGMLGDAQGPHAAAPHADAPVTADAPAEVNGLIGRTMAEIERLVIEATIEVNGGSVTRAARVLDVAPSTLYRKLESWGSKPETK